MGDEFSEVISALPMRVNIRGSEAGWLAKFQRLMTTVNLSECIEHTKLNQLHLGI